MKKFVVLLGFKADAMKEWMANTDEATRKAQTTQLMQEWNTWMSEHAANIVDKGLPLGKNMRVTANGVETVSNDFNWYLVVQAESQEAAAEMLKSHPNLKSIPTSYMEVMGTEGMAM